MNQSQNPSSKPDAPNHFYSSISKLSRSSRTIPTNKDHHFYFNFQEYNNPIQELAKKTQSLLQTLGSSADQKWGLKKSTFPTGFVNNNNDDDDEEYEWLVNINDELFERFDMSVDEFNKIRNQEEETMNNIDNDGFQLVKSRKKGSHNGDVCGNGDGDLGGSSSVKVVSRESNVMGGGKAKVPFHIPSLRRPQDEYKILVNNANQPFEHVWLEESEDGSRLIHPLEKLSVMDFIDKTVSDVEPIKPPPVENTSFKLVQDVKDLKELAAKLRVVDEFAVDLEHNHYRSFQGLTCLMQISTRTEDFIVDTLKLRVQIGPYLRDVFKDPTKRKVMHGADRDIIWLQRDFGIYVCNMFDTGQASKLLKLERKSLEHLLKHFCEVVANKEYQNADWRLRPLTGEMLRYAREDTHYLLYIYDLMKRTLLSSSTDLDCPEALLLEVYQRSYELCMQLYQKEILTENSYLNIYGLHAADLTGEQLAIVAGLVEWRDGIARLEDESTGYILPNKVLIEIAKEMPVTNGKLKRLLKSRYSHLERNLGSVVSIIKRSMKNAAAFEPVAKKLKEEYIEMMAARNANDGNVEAAVEVAGNGSISSVAEDASFEKTVENFIAAPDQNHKVDDSSTSSVSIEVQKKPSRGFGAMFGNAAGKRKSSLETQATEEIKVEQIKSTVSLPFHSFTDKTEPSHHTVNKHPKLQGIPILLEADRPSHHIVNKYPKLQGIPVFLEADRGDEEEEKPANVENSEQKTEDENNEILLDSNSCSDEEKDGNEGSMSLSDLSLSFQKCVQTADEKRTSNKRGKNHSSGMVNVTPFDYAAARKEVRFGEDGSRGGEDSNQGKRERKKSAGGGRKDAGGDERSGDFQLGKRRQAFPATGNRSSTFR